MAVGAALAVAALVTCWGIADAAGFGFGLGFGLGFGHGPSADAAVGVAHARSPLLQGADPVARTRIDLKPGPAGSVLTARGDLTGLGLGADEPGLSPALLRSGGFGKRASFPVDGKIYAQPLYVPGLTVDGVAHRHDRCGRPGRRAIRLLRHFAAASQNLRIMGPPRGLMPARMITLT
jgi:hypothetical protein